MNISQSLSDIQVMLKYVEGLVKENNSDQQTEHLSSIGQSTLNIINHIETLNTSLSAITDDVMTKHAEILENNSVITKESLEELIASIENNELVQKKVHEEIQVIYTKYSESVAKVMSYMTNNKKYQKDIVDEVSSKIENINQNIDSINEKVISKNDMSSIMSDISDQLRTIIDADEEIDKQNQTLLESINGNLLATREMLKSSSDELQSIKGMYTESTSRLSVIDTKMDAMTTHIMREG